MEFGKLGGQSNQADNQQDVDQQAEQDASHGADSHLHDGLLGAAVQQDGPPALSPEMPTLPGSTEYLCKTSGCRKYFVACTTS